MASAAERYLATFSPEDQEIIRSSSGGDINAWYQNALAAGAVPQDIQTPQGGTSGQTSGQSSGPNRQAWNWTPDINAARKAVANAGGPSAVGLPGNANEQQILAWFKQAVEAGGYTERGDNTSETAYSLSGFNQGPDSTGFRKMAKDNNWSEDMDRWSESQLQDWMKDYDPTCPPNDPFRSREDGSCVQKPIDQGGNLMPGGGKNPNAGVGAGEKGGGGEGGGGGRGGAAQPPAPTTFGNQLSMTGNLMQDMLLQQFNTGQVNTYGQNANIFGLGEDRRVGGEGINADKQSQIMGQSLSGGGVWWGQGNDTFQGFDASKKNAEGQDSGTGACPPGQEMTTSGCKPKAQPTPAPAPAQGGVRQGGGRRNQQGIADMMNNQFSAPAAPKPAPTVSSPVSDMMRNQYRQRPNGQQNRFF